MKIAVAGVAGRMGQRLVSIAVDGGMTLTGATVRPGSEAIGRPVSEIIPGAPSDVHLTDDAVRACADAQVWIDFTPPQAALSALDALARSGSPVFRAGVIGSTGWTAVEQERLTQHARRLALVVAGNFSLGVAAVCRATKEIAAAVAEYNWDIDIVDIHHRSKRDAPSGTAYMLADAVNAGGHRAVSRQCESPRSDGSIGVRSLRSGETVGEHMILFSGTGESIRIEHRALNRDVFAHGALQAARWAVCASPGEYDMSDVLGLVP